MSIVLAVLWGSVSDANRGQALDPFEYSQVHMGLPVRIRLYAADRQSAENATRNAFARIAALDQMMSDYRPDSEVRQLESNGAWRPVSPELYAVLQRAMEVARASDGAFDPTVGPLTILWREARAKRRMPDRAMLETTRAQVGWQKLELDPSSRSVRLTGTGMRLDLGGVAKGYILQEAVRTLAQRGLTRTLVAAGGDIVVGDAPPGRDGWRIDAADADPVFASRAGRLRNEALATSGPTAQFVAIDGARYSHVIDPRTGLGLTNDLIARVIAIDATTADALSTALTVVGREGAPELLARFPGVIASLNSAARPSDEASSPGNIRR